jgi:predicted metal-dependent hydrolase
LLWVYQKLARKEELVAAVTPVEYVTGESFSYLGRNYRLKLVQSQREALRLDGETFLLRRDVQKNAAKHFRIWYRRNGLQWLELRVAQLMPRIGAAPTNIVVRDLGNQWGSCSRSGVIAFHWRLPQLPIGLIDYVIVHELAHLKEGHHGPAFWASVERALPDWRQRQEMLAKIAVRYLRLRWL